MFYLSKISKYCWKLSTVITLALSDIDFGLLTKIETSLKEYRHSTVNEFQRNVSKVVTEEYPSISMIEMIILVGDGYLKI